MDSKIRKKLEFNKICETISNFAITSKGKELCENIDELDKNEITKSLNQTSEAVSLLYKVGGIPVSEINDITLHLKILSGYNSLNIQQLLDLLNILQISQRLKDYFFNDIIDKNNFPNLMNLFENLYTNPGIVSSISNSIIDENTIDDSASPELKNIRNNIRKKESEIHSKLQNLLHSKFVQEPIVTIRNNRYVIPIKSEYRSEVKGFVHDISTSGSSVFIEPLSIFEINNEISNLQNDEKNEIEKILFKLSSLFFDQNGNIENTFNLICFIDFIFAKAKFSKSYDCNKPIINDEKNINLINCYHPLLNKDTVVKNTVYLGNEFNTLIITGPNTGGKTVILKTIGLLCLMAKCGLHIPAKEGSKVYIFDKIFVDIGDEQSISNSLSTFSAHITNISFILNNVTSNSLVLIDELGSGTDPVEGSSLAISIIEYLNNLNILSIITTHYHEIKNFALTTKGLKNASVEFNFDTLSPTYKLLIGVPGRSNAFIISKKLGISDAIIERAKDFINEDTNKIEELLNSIYNDKRIIEQEKLETEANYIKINDLKESLESKEENLKLKEKDIINNAKDEAKQILISVKEDADEIIRELEMTKDSSKANIKRKKINDKIKEYSVNSEKTVPIYKELDEKSIKIGLEVYIPSLNKSGTVVSNISKDNTVQVQIGIMKMSFKISELSECKNIPNKNVISKSNKQFTVASISPEINVIGQNVEEACFVIDKYLDNCFLNGLLTVRIVHGKGTGALRNGIHNFLKSHPHVEKFRLGTFGEGEMGVTIVELK